MPFGIGHPHLHINCSLHVYRRVQGSQIFKRNSIISIRSKVMAFLVISLSPWSPHCPRRPHVIPIILCHPRCPHIIPIAPRRSPYSPHGCGLCGLHPMLSPWSPVITVVPTSSLSSPHCPCCPHVIPIAPRRSPCGPQDCGLCGLHPMLSPWSPSSPLSPCHPVIPTSFPHHLEGPHIIPKAPDTHCTHPLPPGG